MRSPDLRHFMLGMKSPLKDSEEQKARLEYYDERGQRSANELGTEGSVRVPAEGADLGEPDMPEDM